MGTKENFGPLRLGVKYISRKAAKRFQKSLCALRISVLTLLYLNVLVMVVLLVIFCGMVAPAAGISTSPFAVEA
jgi:hypothetical protein